MSLRRNLKKIIESSSSSSKEMLIIQYLEDEGFTLDGNGWLDDDNVAQSELHSNDLRSNLDRILESSDGKIASVTKTSFDLNLEILDETDIDHIVFEGTSHGHKLYSPDGRLKSEGSDSGYYEELVRRIKHQALMDVNYKDEDTGYITLNSGKKLIVFTKPSQYGGIVHIKVLEHKSTIL